MKIFTKERALTPSWNLLSPSFNMLKQNIWPVAYLSFLPELLATVGIVMLGENLFSVTGEFTLPDNAGPALTLIGISLVWAILAYPGLTYMQLKAIEGKQVDAWESFKAGLQHVGPMIGMFIVGTILIILGLFALIIPGLILLRGFFLAPYYIVDKKVDLLEALSNSYRDSKPVTAWVWGVIGVSFVLSLASGLLSEIAVVGHVLATAIIYPYIFAPALRYGEIVRKLKIPTSN